ncbi:MAG: ATP-dependent DNA helicase [bacterium]|nr:ATP-dependent DNA helicase [bacterium]
MPDLEEAFSTQYNLLNPEQKKAVDHIDGPLLVLAGPGTGKTQIIALRIANLLDKTQVEPQNILCLTFTETGAVAMRQRLMGIIGTAAYYVKIGTFHAFCNDVIQDNPEKFLFTNNLDALTDVEQVKLFIDVIDKLAVDSPLKPFGAPYFYIRSLISSIQTLKRESISIEDYRKIVATLTALINDVTEQVEDFIAINARKLTMQDCENVVAVMKEADKSELVIKDLALFFDKYFIDSEDPEDSKNRTKFKQTIKRYFEKMKSQLPKQIALADIYELYQQELKERGRYDYEDMLLFVVDQFKQDDELLAVYQEQFQYILVDEYQDTNGAQNQVVDLLGSFFDDPNILTVGDDRQSIYRFQGASLENIIYFAKKFKNKISLVGLKQNYRSHQLILDAAESVIGHNDNSITKYLPDVNQQLVAAQDLPTSKVIVGEFENGHTELYWIVTNIQQLIADGADPSEIAILYRNNSDADDLMDVLEFMEVPFHLQAGLNILQDKQVSNLIELLRYIAASGSNDMLFYILHFDFLKLNLFDIMQLVVYARQEKEDMLTIMHKLDKHQDVGVVNVKPFVEFAKNIYNWRQMSINMPFVRFFEVLLDESGFLENVLQSPEKIEHLNRINTLLDEIKKLNRTDPAMNLKQFLEYFDLLKEHKLTVNEQELQTKKQAVRLMTAHRAKGMEFEHVFIMQCVDKHWGNVPNRQKITLPSGIVTNDVSNDIKEKNEDERRLFYVALTRAKLQVYITYPKFSATGRAIIPSIFLSEIDEQFMDVIDTNSVEDEALDRLQTILIKAPPRDYSQIERQYISDLLAEYKLSASHLNDYLECPRKFLYQDILRVPQPKDRSAGYGIAVHNSLEELVASYTKEKKLAGLKTFLERFEFYLSKQTLRKKDYTESLDFGNKELTAYYNEHQDRFKLPALVENSFSVEYESIPLTGKIDKIEIIDEEKKLAHIVDYKTGNPDNKTSKLAKGKEYHRQLLFYKLLCDQAPQFRYAVNTGEINFVQKSKKNEIYPHKMYEFSDEDVNGLKQLVIDTYTGIQNLEFLDAEENKMCGECRYCQQFAG